MKQLILSITFIVAGFAAVAQANDTWETLSKVSYEVRYNPEYDYDVEYPVFSQEVLALDGSSIEVTGYMLPLEGLNKQNYFIISSLPFAQCFFCGGAGPETVMEVYTKKPIPYTTKPISIKGTLNLNAYDLDQLMYIMKNAELNY